MKRKELSSPDTDESMISTHTVIQQPEKMSRMQVEVDTTINKKSDKYDRQLRLWGENGQKCLENANILLLNATATGTEILKCLVLPGIGRYTIIDNTTVNQTDLGNNFFLNVESLGKSKAKYSCKLLQELNEDCIGSHYTEDPIDLLERDPAIFKNASLVIASRMNQHDLNKLKQFLWSCEIPLVICDSYGVFGSLNINVKEHVIIEVHPDNALEDLRLDMPFTKLKHYMENINLSAMDKLEHSHTPYLVILYKYLLIWRNETGQDWPANYKEKCQIKELIRNGVLKNEHGVNEVEENFDEALQNVNSAFSKTKVPNDIEVVLEDSMANHPLESKNNSVFWILVRALKEFVKDHGILPLRGNLPDMFSDSKRYIELQTIYKEKAEADAEIVVGHVQEILRDLQLANDYVSMEQVKLFCKNAAFLKVIRGDYKSNTVKDSEKIKSVIDTMSDSHAAIYLLFDAIISLNNTEERDEKHVKAAITKLQGEVKFESDLPFKYVEEVLRCDLHELHAIASIMGGIAAQEVIKVITKQFVPCNNTFIYNGIDMTTGSAVF